MHLASLRIIRPQGGLFIDRHINQSVLYLLQFIRKLGGHYEITIPSPDVRAPLEVANVVVAAILTAAGARARWSMVRNFSQNVKGKGTLKSGKTLFITRIIRERNGTDIDSYLASKTRLRSLEGPPYSI